MPTNPPNEPAYKSVAGPVQLTTWANEQDDGSVSYNTYLHRSYRLAEEKRDGKDDDGWRKTNALRSQDLLQASEMLRLAYLRLRCSEPLGPLHTEEG